MTIYYSMEKIILDEKEWKKRLDPDRFRVLREKATELPFTGDLLDQDEEGTFICAGCGNPLFSSDSKFESGCGWPSFDASIDEGKIRTEPDHSHGMIRTEILCAACGGHLGHLFDDGPTSTGRRYCVNSLSLEFIDK